jgi:hypothetical protein
MAALYVTKWLYPPLFEQPYCSRYSSQKSLQKRAFRMGILRDLNRWNTLCKRLSQVTEEPHFRMGLLDGLTPLFCSTQPHRPHLKLYEFGEAPLPNNCHACGTAYPWRQEALAAAVEAAQIGLEGREAEEAAALVTAVSVDSPRTELAAMKLKGLLSKLPKAAYDVALKVIGDVAAATAKSHLGLH